MWSAIEPQPLTRSGWRTITDSAPPNCGRCGAWWKRTRRPCFRSGMISSVAPIEMSPARDVRTDDQSLTVVLADGRVITTPLDWYPRLAHGTPQERARWKLIGGGE